MTELEGVNPGQQEGRRAARRLDQNQDHEPAAQL
jgi:hypothetical protein